MYIWCETSQELGIKGLRQRVLPCTPQGREGWRQIWGGLSFASATGLVSQQQGWGALWWSEQECLRIASALRGARWWLEDKSLFLAT